MKQTTQRSAMLCAVILAVTILAELPAFANPAALSELREKVLIKTVSFSVILVGIEIFAKE
ncbi:hypothetical protein [Pleurocapsa sp. PCC 7319]|uniref:hypothetical protein n=1 Tax=Pleurocapsa sp. PCC 7319 TaxID=118161 RepID=UPI00035C3C4F|nr:hypothetical protein [Pleurocapsa sp. PCC 7319]